MYLLFFSFEYLKSNFLRQILNYDTNLLVSNSENIIYTAISCHSWFPSYTSSYLYPKKNSPNPSSVDPTDIFLFSSIYELASGGKLDKLKNEHILFSLDQRLMSSLNFVPAL